MVPGSLRSGPTTSAGSPCSTSAAERGCSVPGLRSRAPIAWSARLRHRTGADYLRRLHPDVSARIDLVVTDGRLGEFGDERFDMVMSKDSFQTYADPEPSSTSWRACLRPEVSCSSGSDRCGRVRRAATSTS